MFKINLWILGAFFFLIPAHALCQGQSTTENDFIVQPGDVLSIQVWPDETLSGDFPVEESGHVFVPILGAIDVGGVSLDEVRLKLREGYGTAMRSPVVTITPLFRVSVLGEVRQPGLFQVDPTMTLHQVISLAAGFGDDAKENEVQVARGDSILEIGSPLAPTGFDLRSGDRIIVPKKRGFFSGTAVNLFLQSAVLLASVINFTR